MPKPLIKIRDYLEKDLTVRESQIPGSGKGLFTMVKIEKETIITEFTGEKISHTVGAARSILKESDSILYLNKKYLLDSRKDRSCVASFINDAQGEKRTTKFENNTSMCIVNGRIYVVADREIQAGEELFLSYGKVYWR